jgi:hypothetical protein
VENAERLHLKRLTCASTPETAYPSRNADLSERVCVGCW